MQLRNLAIISCKTLPNMLQPSLGVAPGAHLRLKSTSEMLRLTVAYAAVGSFLRALLEWRDLHAAGTGDAYKRQLAAADASSLHTLVDNVLGVSAQLQLDFGDHMYALLSLIPPHRPILQCNIWVEALLRVQ